jgi:hypothetical protein
MNPPIAVVVRLHLHLPVLKEQLQRDRAIGVYISIGDDTGGRRARRRQLAAHPSRVKLQPHPSEERRREKTREATQRLCHRRKLLHRETQRQLARGYSHTGDVHHVTCTCAGLPTGRLEPRIAQILPPRVQDGRLQRRRRRTSAHATLSRTINHSCSSSWRRHEPASAPASRRQWVCPDHDRPRQPCKTEARGSPAHAMAADKAARFQHTTDGTAHQHEKTTPLPHTLSNKSCAHRGGRISRLITTLNLVRRLCYKRWHSGCICQPTNQRTSNPARTRHRSSSHHGAHLHTAAQLTESKCEVFWRG